MRLPVALSVPALGHDEGVRMVSGDQRLQRETATDRCPVLLARSAATIPVIGGLPRQNAKLFEALFSAAEMSLANIQFGGHVALLSPVYRRFNWAMPRYPISRLRDLPQDGDIRGIATEHQYRLGGDVECLGLGHVDRQ